MTDQMTNESEKEGLEARMLSGEPFTYSGLSAARKQTFTGEDIFRDGDHDRLIDRTIQKLRRKGLIAFTRERGRVVWRAKATAQ